MKKIFFIAGLFLLTFSNVFALEELQDVGIAKYAVIEANGNILTLQKI